MAFCQKHEMIFHSENCFSVKNGAGKYLTAFRDGSIKFHANKCSSWEKFYVLDDELEPLIGTFENAADLVRYLNANPIPHQTDKRELFMNNQEMTLNNLLHGFKSRFSQYKVIEKIEIYREVVFLELKTDLLALAIECRTDGKIEIVFRNNETQQRFSIHFAYPFSKGVIVFEKGVCINPHFANLSLAQAVTLSDTLAKVAFIIERCLEVEKNATLWLGHFLKKHQETVAVQTRNNIVFNMVEHMQPRLLSMLDTMKKIRDEELSIARFGDGEIKSMLTKTGCGFQDHDWKLMRELRDITSEKSDLLVCYPSIMSEEPWWHNFWSRYWAECKFYLQKDTYGDSFISRPEAFYQYGEEIATIWKEIWNGKQVCFITGAGSRLNAQHTIFNTIKDSKHIYSKSRNAYDDIDNVMEKCKTVKNVDMFLIALGPTGTVLAHRLYKLGYRALDIGHLNNSYDTVFNNAPRPERL